MASSQPSMLADAADFRQAMRNLASTVHVLTLLDGDEKSGMTVTAVSSLCAEPASLLVCVNKSALLHDLVVRRGRFCLNALGVQHGAIARQFSDRALTPLRFTDGVWNCDAEAPRLADAAASFICVTEQAVEHGTHTILIARVEAARADPASTPLLYLDGGFALPMREDALRAVA